jgi:2-aminobenzoate-CoA ligase
MSAPTGQIDRFAHVHLPPRSMWPEILPLPGIAQSGPFNCVTNLLDRHILAGHGKAVALIGPENTFTYEELNARACRIANVFKNKFGLVSGNRILIRGANSPELGAIWLAIQKIGGIAVTTMPLLRAGELASIVEMARPTIALSEPGISAELKHAIGQTGMDCPLVGYDLLEKHCVQQPSAFQTCITHADDVALIAFTSGTTGKPKATIHFHRDVETICKTLCTHIIKPTSKDVFIGTSPLAFTFGLGGLLLFPLYARASSVLLPRYTPEELLAAIETHKASVCFTVPTFYQRMARIADASNTRTLRLTLSSGEALPLPVRREWRDKTGLEMTELLGSTEMLHGFIGAAGDNIRDGFIGPALPGYDARVIDNMGKPVAAGMPGRLAVRGPTGCRYLDDQRQSEYVQNGWNITGDICAINEDGYVSYHGRFDDMIISAGYNISAIEVENALLTHSGVAECVVIGLADQKRGQIVAAHVVATTPVEDEQDFTKELQAHVRGEIAPYKYPRRIILTDHLPRNESGKIQRFKLQP